MAEQILAGIMPSTKKPLEKSLENRSRQEELISEQQKRNTRERNRYGY